MIGSTLLCLLLVSGWVSAWLYWIFEGEIRQFLFLKVFPKSWLNGTEPERIIVMNDEELEMFFGMECGAPVFFRKLLTCPGCASNWVSIAGTSLAAVPFVLTTPFWAWFLLPLVWAWSAYAGHRIYNYL